MLTVELTSEIKLRSFYEYVTMMSILTILTSNTWSLCEKCVNSDKRCHFSYQK